ncbi:GNAT family N-acetyltransferase [Sorangium sp. So ce1014]|uniref:GNAT family N-acetyltransferase n=1 Tax=Sorangium sp. So ce1014 TaxID=3133326 RepID=UPI003F637E24
MTAHESGMAERAMARKILPIRSDSPLYAGALRLRYEVFVVEQAVPEDIEVDELDEGAQHFVVLDGDEVVATMRIVPYEGGLKVGRVAVRKDLRGTGLGRRLLEEAIRIGAAQGAPVLVLNAQVVAAPFYRKLGFAEEGPIFDEAGIPHTRMVRRMI